MSDIETEQRGTNSRVTRETIEETVAPEQDVTDSILTSHPVRCVLVLAIDVFSNQLFFLHDYVEK